MVTPIGLRYDGVMSVSKGLATATVKLGLKREVRVRLPEAMTRRMRLRKGAKIEVVFLGDGVYLIPAGRIPRAQRFFWTPEWQAQEREADADNAAGRVRGPFDTVDAAITALRA